MGFLGMWNPYLALFSRSDVAIPGEIDMLEMHHVVKLQDFLSSGEFHIKNELKTNEINIEIRNRTELNQVEYES